MKCDAVRPLLSAAIDGALRADVRDGVDRHVASCPRCTRYVADLTALRRAVRYEALGEVPDVTERVLAVVAREPQRQRPARAPRRWTWRPALPAVATFVVAAVVGGLLVGPRNAGNEVLAADLHERVVAAQRDAESLHARIEVTERGWHPDVPVRTYEGQVRFRSPESIELSLGDTTTYPDEQWPRNDVARVVDGAVAWSRGHGRCPADAQPACSQGPVRPRALTSREPFADQGDALDLVVPVRSFDVADTQPIREEVVDGRPALHVATTVAQVRPLLDGVVGVGNWRELHFSDRVDLWLERDLLVPLRVEVRASTSDERALWAAPRGYRDGADAILEIGLSSLSTSAPATALTPTPSDAVTRDAGFRDSDVTAGEVPSPAYLPAGMEQHRSGHVGGGSATPVAVRSWTDGRAWLKVRATSRWRGGRLFGELGDVVRRTDLGAGIAYVAEDGARVGIHGDALDLVVAGSLPTEELLAVAASLGIDGRPVPSDWAEGGGATMATARAALPGLVAADGLDGFALPAIRVVGSTVTLTYAGAGDRSFVLTQVPATVLPPVLDVTDVRGVVVRGATGRYSPDRGELEWIQDGNLVSLRSRTLALAELVSIADRLARV